MQLVGSVHEVVALTFLVYVIECWSLKWKWNSLYVRSNSSPLSLQKWKGTGREYDRSWRLYVVCTGLWFHYISFLLTIFVKSDVISNLLPPIIYCHETVHFEWRGPEVDGNDEGWTMTVLWLPDQCKSAPLENLAERDDLDLQSSMVGLLWTSRTQLGRFRYSHIYAL